MINQTRVVRDKQSFVWFAEHLLRSFLVNNRERHTQHVDKVQNAIINGGNILGWGVAESYALVELRRGVFPNVAFPKVVDWLLLTMLSGDELLQYRGKKQHYRDTLCRWLFNSTGSNIGHELCKGLDTRHVPATAEQKILNDLRLLCLLPMLDEWTLYVGRVKHITRRTNERYGVRFRKQLKGILARGKVFYTPQFGGLNEPTYNVACDMLNAWKLPRKPDTTKKTTTDFTSNWSNGSG